jgi:hypothetical protein
MKNCILSVFIASAIFLAVQFKNPAIEFAGRSSIAQIRKLESSLEQNDTTPSQLTWVDSSIIDYIKNSNDQLMKLARDSDIVEQWILDAQYYKGRKYIVVEIGHDSKIRFVPDSWLYLDSSRKKIFVYDTIKDKLIKWER